MSAGLAAWPLSDLLATDAIEIPAGVTWMCKLEGAAKRTPARKTQKIQDFAVSGSRADFGHSSRSQPAPSSFGQTAIGAVATQLVTGDPVKQDCWTSPELDSRSA